MVRIDAAYNAMIVQRLFETSRRPATAIRVWAQMLTAVDTDTREILRSREELAATLEIHPNSVSTALTELEALGAISRVRRRVAGVRGPGMVHLYLAGAEPAANALPTSRRRPRGQQAHLRLVAGAPDAA